MIARAETSQLHLFAILNLLGVTVTPLQGNLGVGVGIDEDIEGAISIQHGQEGHRGCDLSEDGLNFSLDFGLSLFFWCIVASAQTVSMLSVNVRATYSGAAFSLSAVFFEDFDFALLPNI